MILFTHYLLGLACKAIELTKEKKYSLIISKKNTIFKPNFKQKTLVALEIIWFKN